MVTFHYPALGAVLTVFAQEHTGGDPGVNVDRILVDDIPPVQVPGRLLALSSWTGEAHCSCVVTLTTVFSDESGWCASDW